MDLFAIIVLDKICEIVNIEVVYVSSMTYRKLLFNFR